MGGLVWIGDLRRQDIRAPSGLQGDSKCTRIVKHVRPAVFVSSLSHNSVPDGRLPI